MVNLFEMTRVNSILFSLAIFFLNGTVVFSQSYFGNGIKIGEVKQDSAIVWLRLTENPDFRTDGTVFKPEDEAIPEGLRLGDMRFSLTGREGEARVGYRPQNGRGFFKWSKWRSVDASKDYTAQFRFSRLDPGTAYEVVAESRIARSNGKKIRHEGGFTTAPDSDSDADVSFVVVTCHDFIRRDDPENGHFIYPAMAKLKPDFLVHAGDIEYYDKPGPWAKTVELARYKWNRLFALPYQRNFYSNHAAYFIKDDHDTLKNDSWPGQTYGEITWDQGLALFREQVPMGEKTFRSIRWGKHLQIWMVEGRDFRSPNDMTDGPEKTIWGAAQKKWFFDSFERSDATFRILISPTPIVGPDRANKNDNHANAGFTHEGDEIRSFLSRQKNAYVICGDRHWQYVSVHPDAGVWEFSCGPGADQHAGGSLKTDAKPRTGFCAFWEAFSKSNRV